MDSVRNARRNLELLSLWQYYLQFPHTLGFLVDEAYANHEMVLGRPPYLADPAEADNLERRIALSFRELKTLQKHLDRIANLNPSTHRAYIDMLAHYVLYTHRRHPAQIGDPDEE